jgi:hypothetical protein
MWLKWLPWRWAISRFARSQGFLDPISIMARLHRFAQPSEVAEPIELLRAGMVFHARGLINTRAIQHNLDWVWPYWVEQQFNPLSPSFVPRAFSISHINLTHRNWTAVGQPDLDCYPIVDPRGLLTPHWDGWSLDCWIVPDEGNALLPSRVENVQQEWLTTDQLAVRTSVAQDGLGLVTTVDMENAKRRLLARLQCNAEADRPGWLVVALRPVNPEGVSFIHRIAMSNDQRRWDIDDRGSVEFDQAADRSTMSHYHVGDVLQRLSDPDEQHAVQCEVGMATAAAMFRISPGETRSVTVRTELPLENTSAANRRSTSTGTVAVGARWPKALQGACRAELPDEHYQQLYDAALRTVVLHCPGEVYPGPYTYKRFWFRDAAFILNALLAANQIDRARQCIERFPQRQTWQGYFRSQDGEWDSNGAALWIIHRYQQLSNEPLDGKLLKSVERGAHWIVNKRLSDDADGLHAGLMPAGFSAEHLGPNDYYYWDDFWSAAGLRAAAAVLDEAEDSEQAEKFDREAERILRAVDRSIEASDPRRDRAGVPASPYRRMDSGAIGSICAAYPLLLWPADDGRMKRSIDFLLQHCMVHGGFFQDMIHSGINAYLTLHIAQVLLRAGDARCFELINAVADLATPTGQWPEAIHPTTRGGCMGDGQHVWAAAEWILMMRNCFVREEDDRLILASGISREWLTSRQPIRFGPTPTRYGTVSIEIIPDEADVLIRWEGDWQDEAPLVEIDLPNTTRRTAAQGESSIRLPLPDRAYSEQQQ